MKRIIIASALSIVLIILMKILLKPPHKNDEIIDQFWVNKTFPIEQYDIVVLGDSRTYRGVSTQALSNTVNSDVNTINLGYSSGGFNNEFIDFALSKFDPKSKKKVLVLGITPNSLTPEAIKNEQLKSFLAFGAFDQFRYQYLSPTLKYFTPFNVVDLLQNKKNPLNEEYHSGGWVESSHDKSDTSAAIQSYINNLSTNKVTAEIQNNLISKFKSIDSLGIKIIAFRPPSTVSMRKLEDTLSRFNEEIIKQGVIKNGGTWIDFNDVDFISYDGSHLDRKSAIELSKKIGLEIEKIYRIKN